jgi:hypothetical protein
MGLEGQSEIGGDPKMSGFNVAGAGLSSPCPRCDSLPWGTTLVRGTSMAKAAGPFTGEQFGGELGGHCSWTIFLARELKLRSLESKGL